MSQQYTIAKNRAVNLFFTKSSSYDRPQWVNESAASTYPSAELAEAAVRKLYKHGAYEARIVFVAPIAEAVSMTQMRDGDEYEDGQEYPDSEIETPVSPTLGATPANTQDVHPEQTDHAYDADEPTMVAKVQVSTATIPAYSTEHPDAEDDAQLDDDEDTIVDGPDPMNDQGLADQLASDQSKRPRQTNNFESLDGLSEPAATEVSTQVANGAEEALVIPPKVMADLAKCIDKTKKEAEFIVDYDDTKSAFLHTVVNSFEEMQAALKDGTVADLKRAQLMITSWTNLITNHLPQSVQLFVISGGRKPSLKNLFDDRWYSKKAVE